MKYVSGILMVRPRTFGFNEETLRSNFFQKKLSISGSDISEMATVEFDKCVELLKRNGINPLIYEESGGTSKPDSVFPNNWIATNDDSIFLFPMLSHVRRSERNGEVINMLRKKFMVENVIDLTGYELEDKFLEGTGSMVMDHDNKVIYALLSSRTNSEVLSVTGSNFGYKTIVFTAVDDNRNTIYHTNVMMSIGNEVAVICMESIESNRETVLKELERSGKRILEISLDQMKHFCGNILNINLARGSSFWIMSATSFDKFHKDQLQIFECSGKQIVFPLDIIEKVGGGGARCMIAEIFLKCKV